MLFHLSISGKREIKLTSYENHGKGIFLMSSSSGQRDREMFKRALSFWTRFEMCINLLQDELCFFSVELLEFHDSSFIKMS